MPMLITESGQQIDPTKHLYTLAELSKYSKASLKQIDEWIKRDIIQADKNPGRGKGRKFTFWNVLEAAIAENFSTFIRINYLEKAMGQVREKFYKQKGVKLKNNESFFLDVFPDNCSTSNLHKIATDTKKAHALTIVFWHMTKMKKTLPDATNFGAEVLSVNYSNTTSLPELMGYKDNIKSFFDFGSLNEIRHMQVTINIIKIYCQIAFEILHCWE